jgi:hypothetical protein
MVSGVSLFSLCLFTLSLGVARPTLIGAHRSATKSARANWTARDRSIKMRQCARAAAIAVGRCSGRTRAGGRGGWAEWLGAVQRVGDWHWRWESLRRTQLLAAYCVRVDRAAVRPLGRPCGWKERRSPMVRSRAVPAAAVAAIVLSLPPRHPPARAPIRSPDRSFPLVTSSARLHRDRRIGRLADPVQTNGGSDSRPLSGSGSSLLTRRQWLPCS